MGQWEDVYMKYFCNPINYEYKYQFNKKTSGFMEMLAGQRPAEPQEETFTVSRESADPSMIMFKGMYYLFPSMTCGFLYSQNLTEWKYHPLKNVNGYDYAPDVCVIGDYVVISASSHEYGRFYRTKDLFADEFEVIESPFAFWDPATYVDDDGRVYFYWGCGAGTPIFGLEIDPNTLQPITERKALILADEETKGFERTGDDHNVQKPSPEEVEGIIKSLEARNMPEDLKASAMGFVLKRPFNEGAWMTKYKGKYYLQYATPGTQYNVYGDAVYVGDSPLGEFTLAKSNPFSYKPGGFIPGAGHGSTMIDAKGRYWHTSTQRISLNHNFERRLGLWRAGFDQDGEMFCDTRYGDFPIRQDQEPWEDPDFMLLSYGKNAKASSQAEGKPPEKAFDENICTWWRAASNAPGEWLEVDLGQAYDVRAIQVNFADDGLALPLPEGEALVGPHHSQRWIDLVHQPTRWLLEGSVDGVEYFVIEDKRNADTDLSHDFILREEGLRARYVKLTVISLPYKQAACVSGLRVFGIGSGALPKPATNVKAIRESDLDIALNWEGNTTGYCVLWGHREDKLYLSYQVYDKKVRLGGLIKGQPVYLRVDSFNESGITQGEVFKI